MIGMLFFNLVHPFNYVIAIPGKTKKDLMLHCTRRYTLQRTTIYQPDKASAFSNNPHCMNDTWYVP